MKRSVRILLFIVAAVALVICVLCCLYIYQYFWGDKINSEIESIAAFSENAFSPVTPSENVPDDQSLPSVIDPSDDHSLPTIESSIDFDELEALNPDIYAWIEIPSLNISLAVLQHPENDEYYLRHAANGSRYSGGSIFSQRLNSKTFEDPMTVLYGHNYKSMFGPLNRLSNPADFEDCKVIRIYTRERVYEYSVFAAYPFSNRHLLYLCDFTDPEAFDSFFAGLHDMPGGNFRRDLFPTSEDRVLTLSTCVLGSRSRRFLIEAVLTTEYEVVDKIG